MTIQWDLETYSRDNQLVLVVEVKSILDKPPEWAARLRRNILAHGTFPNAPYLLMVFPDRFYLWARTETNHEPIEPTYVIDARPILQPYFDQAGITADRVSGQSLEIIVTSWLNEVIHKTPNELDTSEQWLIDSGLYNAVAGGNLEHEVLV